MEGGTGLTDGETARDRSHRNILTIEDAGNFCTYGFPGGHIFRPGTLGLELFGSPGVPDCVEFHHLALFRLERKCRSRGTHGTTLRFTLAFVAFVAFFWPAGINGFAFGCFILGRLRTRRTATRGAIGIDQGPSPALNVGQRAGSGLRIRHTVGQRERGNETCNFYHSDHLPAQGSSFAASVIDRTNCYSIAVSRGLASADWYHEHFGSPARHGIHFRESRPSRGPALVHSCLDLRDFRRQPAVGSARVRLLTNSICHSLREMGLGVARRCSGPGCLRLAGLAVAY